MNYQGQPIESGLDVLLALLYSPGDSGHKTEPIKGITRLQKILFLLWKEGKFFENVPNLYGFDAYDYGPCMDDLYDDLDFSAGINLIKIEENPSGNEFEGGDEDAFLKDFGFTPTSSQTRRDFKLTEAGEEAGRDIFNALSKEEQQRLVRIKTRFNAMRFFDLLRYVYQKYPKFAERSVLSL